MPSLDKNRQTQPLKRASTFKRTQLLQDLIAVLAATFLALAISASARAQGPVISIGGGIEANSQDNVINVLLRANLDLPSSNQHFDQCFIATFRGDYAFTQNAADRPVPYLDIHFTPFKCVNGLIEDGLVFGNQYSMLPMGIRRDLRLDEKFGVTVSALGASIGGKTDLSDKIGVYAQVAADALGFKEVSHISGLPAFKGLHVGMVDAQSGIIFKEGDNFHVRIALGVQSDLNLGGRSDAHGLAIQSDLQAYVEIRADIAHFLEIFARGSMNGTSSSMDHYFQLMTGVTLYF